MKTDGNQGNMKPGCQMNTNERNKCLKGEISAILTARSLNGTPRIETPHLKKYQRY